MKEIERIFDKLDEIIGAVSDTKEHMATLSTKLDIIDQRGTTASVSEIKRLEHKFDKRVFGAMTTAVTAMGAVIWTLVKDKFHIG